MVRTKARGWWYPWMFVAGLLVVAAVNGVMISYAVDTFPGLDAQDAYQKGLAYNRTLAAARAEERLGWSAEVRFVPGAAGGEAGELEVVLAGPDGRPLGGLAVSAELIRPTRAGLDQHVALQDGGGGTYRADVALPLPGQWDAHVWARSGEKTWQTSRRILVP